MRADELQWQGGSLERLARSRFGALSSAEVKLVRAAPKGDIAYCGPNRDDKDPSNDPGKAKQWGPERQIRADLIRWLCVDRLAMARVDSTGIAVHAAKVVGKLNLSFVTIAFPLQLWRSALTDDANLIQLETPFLDLSGSWARSVAAEGARVKILFLGDGFRAEGTVFLTGAQIGWTLNCHGGMFISQPRTGLSDSSTALHAENITVNGKVDLSGGFRAEGEVRLWDAQIHGILDCSGSAFINPLRKDPSGSGVALNADRIAVSGNLLLSAGFRAEGEVRLPGAHVGGNLDCSGGAFINPPAKDLSGSGAAVYADSITVNGSLFLSRACRAEGEVRLANSQIGGSLYCTGGTFINPSNDNLNTSGSALSVFSTSLRGNVFLDEGFRAEGNVDLTVTRVAGDLIWRGGMFRAARLDLRDASTSSIMDNTESWPQQGRLYLDGFIYGRIADGPRDAETRLKWLNLQPQKPFTRHPYLQLAKVLREGGDDDGARRVLIAMEDRQWEAKEDHRWIDPLQRWPLRVTVGYGYRPLWAFWEVLGLSALGWIIYRRSYIAGNMAPTDKDAYQSFKSDGQVPANYPTFAPLIFSVENSLPLVKLGQGDKWQPDPNPVRPPSRQRNWPIRSGRNHIWTRFVKLLQPYLTLLGLHADSNLESLPSAFRRWGTTPRFLRWFLWIQILLGWLLATLFVAGVTGIVRTD